jgi:MurNAc alpha-1-phosphate uridylyltransferase
MMAMVLAAGRGERLRPVTDHTPKALVDVGGRPLIVQHLRRLADAGIRNVVINLDWLGEQIVEALGDGRQYGLTIAYSPEFGNVLETAGGILCAMDLLGPEPFWVINADVYTDYNIAGLTLEGDANGHLVLVPTPRYKPRGDFELVNGKVRNSDAPSLTFSGLAIYRPAFFAGLAAGRAALAPLLQAAADRGELAGSIYNGVWEDIGTPERLQQVRNQVSR